MPTARRDKRTRHSRERRPSRRRDEYDDDDEDENPEETFDVEDAEKALRFVGEAAETALDVVNNIFGGPKHHPMQREERLRGAEPHPGRSYIPADPNRPKIIDAEVVFVVTKTEALRLFDIPEDSPEQLIRQKYAELSRGRVPIEQQERVTAAYELLMQDAIKRQIERNRRT